MGVDALMAKMDWASAYRQILVRPADLHLLGFQHRGNFYVDTRLPCGLRSSTGIHARYPKQHCWVLTTFVRGLHACHFADDLFLMPGVLSEAERAFARKKAADNLTRTLRIETRRDKKTDGERQLVFLGIHLDSHLFEMSMPQENVDAALELFRDYLRQKQVTITDVQRVFGKQNWMCAVVAAGKTFTGRSLALLRHQNAPRKKNKRAEARHHFRVGASAKKDVEWWIQALSELPARSYFEEALPERSIDFHIECDAFEHAGGAVHGGD